MTMMASAAAAAGGRTEDLFTTDMFEGNNSPPVAVKERQAGDGRDGGRESSLGVRTWIWG